MKNFNFMNQLIRIRRGSKANLNLFRFAAMVVVLLLGIGNAWAGSSPTTNMTGTSTNTGQGLVYASTSSTANPRLSNYAATSDKVSQSTSKGKYKSFYFWAKAVRGYEFDTWGDRGTNTFPNATSDSKTKLNQDPSIWNGTADVINGGNGGSASTNYTIKAYFKAATSYDITYAVPVGGSYDIAYKYLTINSSTKFAEKTDNYSMTPTTAEAFVETSYAADVVTLTATGANFAGWYEGTTSKGTGSGTNHSYTYPITKAATITALFKTMSLGTATGDLSPAVEVLGTMSPNPTITVPVTAHGSWSASDFTVTFTENGSRGDITKGTVSYAQNSGNVLSSEGTLTIPFTYNPSSWGNTEVNVTVSPKDGSIYGNSIEFTIKASATQVLDYEACILLENETEPQSSNTGTLAEMVTLANSMDSKFTLQLAKNVTISSPLSLRKSMKFDLNDKKITSTGTSAFSIDAAGVDVQIVDEGFGGLGEVATESAQSENVSVVTFTQKAKLTMQGGTLSAKNTGSGSAYGINVTQGSTFYMTNGLLTVTGVSEAQGVHVATANDYATLNGGSITVTAPTNAYGVWSAGQSNVTSATIDVETTTGANAYGVYVNGGVSTLTTNTVSATAKTTGAYAAYVNAGRLNGNGGSFAAEAVTSGVYGVHVQAGAEAVVQQNAVVTVEATGASGTSVFGVNNLGTVSLAFVSVTATSPTTAATAVNTATSATATTIEGGTYRANTTDGTAYGLHHQYGTLTVDGGEFKAVGGGTDILGARVIVNATIANATLWGEAQGDGGNTAYGFKGDVAGKTISLTNCTIKGISNNNKAYAIYSNTNLTAAGCTLTATATKADEAYGVYAENGTNQIVNCDATVTVNTITAYGVKHVAGSLTIEGGVYNVTANQTSATAAQSAVLYGLHNAESQTTTVNGAAFHANAANTSWSENVYGALINGTLISTNGGYSARGKNKAYGIYGNSSSTLTLAGNTVGSEITDGTVSYGIYAKKNFTIDGDIVNAVGNKTGIYALFFDATNSVGEVLDGKFSAQGNNTNGYGPLNDAGTVGKVKLKGGVAKTAANLKKYVVSGYDVYTLDNTHPDYAAGYRYTIATENPSPYVCYIKNGNKYETLAAALQYTKDNTGTYTIIMTQNHTLPKGDYELPSTVTLIIPRNSSQTTLNTTVPKDEVPVVEMLEEHLRLTLASGANLNVSGKIEVGGKLYSQEGGKISYNNSPYARIQMESGSLMQLNNGARLYAWGFISGSGSITAKSGSEVHEIFQIGDLPAISPLGQYYLDNSAKYFPVQVYSIQSIEVPTTYYYNSQLITSMYEYQPGSLAHGWNGEENIKLVGKDGAMFLVTSNDESSWVRKSYVGGKQIYEVNSSAKLGSLTINVGSYAMKSINYILPITATMKIHILDGTMEITQSTMFQPGTQVEIDKTATLKINAKDSKNEDVKVYLIDQDQWRTTTSNPDAAWNVHGKVEVAGKLYTTNKGTTTKTDGANIYSTNADAGTVSFSSAAASATTFKLVTGASNGLQTKTVDIESAKLKNNDGSYTATAGTTSGEAWIYLNNVWQKTYTNGCFEVIGSTVYAKPSGYVALKKSQTVGGKLTGVEETNHTYLTADDKILILMDECQWWEVVPYTPHDGWFECMKPGYEGVYYYNTSSNKWELKTVTVTFYSAETGNSVLKNITTDLNGIPDQAVIATNPTKPTTDEFTYAFYGWKSSVTGSTYKWTDQLEEAGDDMSYRPVFTKTKRNYTITLVNANNGANVPLEVPYGETPEYTPKKDATAQYTYTFNGWSPAFTTVTGTATYTATWSSVVNEYNITWKSGNEILEVDENQPYGTATAYNCATPTKDADDDYEYAFSKWKSSLNGISYNNGSTPTVAGETTYEAQYTTTPRYAITFNNYDGTQLARTIYTQGETPAYGGVPARKRDDNGYFKFIGWKNSNGTDYAANATLPSVTKKETYTAQYEYVTDFFTITLKNVDGNGATWSGKFGEGSTPFYNPNEDDVPVIPTKTSANPQYSYVFNGWSLTSGGAKLDPTPAVTEDKTYWALFTQVENKYTVSFAANNDAWGIVSKDDVKEVPYGTAITTSGNTLTVNGKTITATPAAEDAQYIYRFEGWESVPGTVTGTTNIQAVFKAYVATVEAGGNTTYHTTVADAFTTANALTNNPTVTMYKNAGVTSEIAITKSMTIDLNGKTISSTLASATGVFNINASGKTITIKDSDTGGKIDHTASYSGKLYGINFTAGSLDIIGGTIYAKNTTTANNTNYRAYGIYPNGGTSITMSSGAIEAHTPNNPSPFGIYSEVACTFTMTGGTIIANGMSAARGIYVKGTTNLTDATITVSGSSSHTIFAVSGNMTINSGTYTTTGGGESYCIFHRNNAITINGGYFNTPNKLYKRDTNGTYTGTITLKGGCYSNDVELADKCASGYQVFALTDAEKAEVGSDYNYKVTTTFTVTFNANGHGTPPVSQVIEKGKKATEPAAPTAEGYTFGGWFKEAGCANAWDFNTDVVNANTTLFAKWTANPYTITFDSNGGSEVASITQGYGTSVTAPAAPTKTGYTFNGWSPAVPSTMPLNGRTCVAQWTPNINTAYTVEHYWQNINDDNYTLHETVNMTGTTDAATEAVAKNYTGFEAVLPFEQGTVAPDGSTVVKIYYNRETYLIKWEVKLNGEQEAYKEETLRYGAMPSYGSTPAKEQSESEVYAFSGWSPSPYLVDKAQTYSGSFHVSPRPYTITFVNDNGVELWHSDFGWGSTPSYDYEHNGTPESFHTGDGYAYEHTGWKPAVAEVTGTATYTAVYRRSADAIVVNTPETVVNNTIAPTTTVEDHGTLTIGDADNNVTLHTNVTVVENGGELVVSNGSSIGKEDPSEESIIIVESGGQLDVKDEGSVEADVFIIEATIEEQGEEDAKEEVQVSGELSEGGTKNLQAVYYDLTRKHGNENFLARVWYAVAVPWAVEVPTYANGGVYIKRGDDYIPQRLGATFDLLSYDGACRATNGAGANCWVYLEDEIVGGADAVMVPGKLYMIYLTEETSTIRFKKKAGEAIHTKSLTVSAHNETTDNEGKDANWNGIANPATYKAYMNVSVGGLVQKFVPGTQPRDGGHYVATMDLDEKQAVGQPFFVQVDPSVGAEASVVVTRNNTPTLAPRRAQAEGDKEVRYAIGIAANGKLADRLYIQTAEEKEDKYVIGKDMSKMSVSSYVAQMWVARYDVKLCLNTVAMARDKAVYPLGIYAPQAGEYMIFAPADMAPGDIIYLTYDGRVIWNLTMAPYYASLDKGTTTHYGLRLVHSDAPAVTTGVDEVHSDNTLQCTKVIMDDHVYILRGEELYTITGQKAK